MIILEKKKYLVTEEIDFFWQQSENSGITFLEGSVIELEYNDEIEAWIYENDGDVYWQYNYSIEDKIMEIQSIEETKRNKEQKILDNVRGYTKDWEEGIITNEEYIQLINKQMNDVQSLEEKDLQTIINMGQYAKSRSSREE